MLVFSGKWLIVYCFFVLNVWNSLHFSSLYNQPPACRSKTLQAFNRRRTCAEVDLAGVLLSAVLMFCRSKTPNEVRYRFMWSQMETATENDSLSRKTDFESVSPDLRVWKRNSWVQVVTTSTEPNTDPWVQERVLLLNRAHYQFTFCRKIQRMCHWKKTIVSVKIGNVSRRC